MNFLRRTWLLWAAVAVIGGGYILLSGGDITVAPVLLVAGYCVMVPLFLWQTFRRDTGE